MHQADLKHPNKTLQDKLELLYGLDRDKTIDLGFRPPYLELLEKMGHPHLHLPPIIHVAGTNGKGSVIAMMHSMLEAGGYNVHSYTSPHLKRFNERIVLSGQEIDDAYLEQIVDHALFLNQKNSITFFEITTAIAFKAFSENPADILLLEVGLGGRLDCTNIIKKPVVSIINKISKDHQEFLGDTIKEITNEKSGIMKSSVSCIVGKQNTESYKNSIESVLDKNSRSFDAPLIKYGKDWNIEVMSDGFKFMYMNRMYDYPKPNLLGQHQIENAGAALAALEHIQDQFPLTVQQKSYGLQNICWPGRLEKVQTSDLLELIGSESELWYDGGHNDSAGDMLRYQIEAWEKTDPKDLYLIVGMKKTKDFQSFLKPIIPQATSLTLIPLPYFSDYLRRSDLNKDLEINISEENSLRAALKTLDHVTNARILVCGSLYLASEF